MASRGTPDPTDQVDRVEDDVLRLVYLACHPVLAPDARAALTPALSGSGA